jgi:hypothetical protein
MQLAHHMSAVCEVHAFRTTGFGMERGLRLARQQQQDWLMQIDSDEIVLPTSSAPSLATCEHGVFELFGEFWEWRNSHYQTYVLCCPLAVLRQQPDHVSSLRFMNIEGQAEAGDLTNRFEQVTLFRTHQVAMQQHNQCYDMSLHVCHPTQRGHTAAYAGRPDSHDVLYYSTTHCRSRTNTASISVSAGTAASSTCMPM